MRPQRLLLIEDDDTVRRFVLQAIEPLGLEVLACSQLEEARRALAVTPFDLVFTDLELPDGSCLDLVNELLSGRFLSVPRVVVYSDGLYAAMRDHLQGLGVWRNLVKPSSLPEIESCAREALGMVNWPEAPTVTPAANQTLRPHERLAIETHFDGDAAFYTSFKASCCAQFKNDVQMGDAACVSVDAQGLRRVAHNLKSILLTLGYADHSLCARALEQLAQKEHWSAALEGWQDLKQRLTLSFSLQD
ncbi:MAG TPA: response regulator [Macromonas sp.]|nr:response regulator [Macromonas sp.]